MIFPLSFLTDTDMMYRSTFVLLLISTFLQLATSDAVLSVRFLTFRNPRGQVDSGQCCDGMQLVCSSPCDHSFTVCLDQIDGPVDDINSCIYGKFTSTEINDANYINFEDRIGDITNPIIWRLSLWPGRVRLKIDVLDIDPLDLPDHVDYVQTAISVMPVSSQHGTRFVVGNRVELTLEVRAYCGQDYYNLDCSIYCKPRDDSGGHYSCDKDNGTQICLTGWTGNNCHLNRDDCRAITCQNGGLCRDLINMFHCQCLPGFEGRFCEGEINECLSPDICRHGDCVNTPGSFTCTCFVGYTGKNCGTDIDDCINSPCKNGALCYDHVGDFQCSCPAGFTGKICDTDVDECELDPCRNDGNCTNIVGTYSCNCLTGYHGKDCSLDINECESNPCTQNGTCMNHYGGYRCDCHVGYEGRHCESNINECLKGVCKNGARCNDLNGSFYCACSQFWEGRTCQQDVDECMSSPCEHNGICKNFAGGFVCVCPEQFTGDFCEEDENECEMVRVCQNNSTCDNSFGSFNCECLEGWRGKRCEHDIDECELNESCNIGICINTNGGFHCVCPTTWTGQRCEVEVKVCDILTNPCRNNATCSHLAGTFSCQCPKGWIGSVCNEDVDECMQDPDLCQMFGNSTCNNSSLVNDSTVNHFVCLNTQPGYMCVCDNGWTGLCCNEDINECLENPFLCSSGRIFWNDNTTNLDTGIRSHTVCLNRCPGYECMCTEGWSGTNCDVNMNDNSSVTHIPNYMSSAVVVSAGNDTQAVECATPDCYLPDSRGTRHTDQDDVRSTVTHLVDITSSSFSEFKNSTNNFSANYSIPSLPIYLDCQITPDKEESLRQALERFFNDIPLFLGKTLVVSHKSEILMSGNGQAVTSVLPIIKVDGIPLPVSVIVQAINQAAHKLADYLDCPLIQFINNVGGNYSFSALPSNSTTQRWYAGIIVACALAVILIASLVLLKCRRRIMVRRKRTFNIRSIEVSRSFRNDIYQNKAENVRQTSLDKTPVLKSVTKTIKNDKSNSKADKAHELSSVPTGRHMDHANEDHNNGTISPSTLYTTTKQLSRIRASCPVTRYCNAERTNNMDGETWIALAHQQTPSLTSSSCVRIIEYPYVQMLGSEEFKIELYMSNWQPMARLHERRKMASAAEIDKYTDISYIDDPLYTEIDITEEQGLPPSMEHIT